MDREASTSHGVLESMLLDESAEPTQLTLSLLEDITNRFSFDLQIGRGGFAVVYKGIVGKGLVAVKKLSNTFCIPEKKFHEEVKCLIKAKHKNIVRFLGYCAETQGKVEEIEGNFVMADQRNWLLCFEYVCNGSLDRHITDATRGLNWRFRYRIIRGICEGLLFLHEKHILHLDLKPANILLDAHMVPKIADFGLSRCLGEEQTRAITQNIIGTLGYVDPQYLKTGEMEYASDIYSLGVIIMEILAGVRRYHTDESVVESWINLLRASEGDMQMEQVRVCYNIGIQCMDLDPKKRPVARHIVDMLDKTIDNSDETSIASSLWGGQHMKENINSHRTSNFRSTRKYFEFFIRKARRNFDRNNMLNLEKSYFISIFRKDELEPILRSSNFIGKGAFTEVYKGVIDNTLVAVKKTVNGKVHKNNELKNEVIIQSQISHKNIVLLIGCCLEMDTPVLVYEFLPGGSLHDILHRDSKVPLNLDVRLTIVAESAQGLAYLHSQARTKICHGDVRTESILLDDNLLPKISDFGLSRVIARDSKHAYMDTALSTEKSDVYSFGIVILEVISRKKDTHADDFSLLKSFLEVHKQGKKATNLFDTEISVAGDLELLDCLAEIAMECLNLDVNQRPSMTDVAERLLILSRSHGLHARHTVDKTRRADYSFVTGISSSLAEQDTNLHGTTISSSVSTGLYKFNNLDIFNRKGRRKFDRNVTHTLQKSHFIKIFKKEEIREIIRSSTSIGKGAFSEVYKGVADDALVAVKKMLDSNALKSKRLEDKVIIQSQIIHKNIVRLIGYCLEMDSPVLVYEFLSSGTLHDILHSGSMVPLNLDVRLSMVAESAQGLAYLHSHTHCRILHGDVRPANILLDDNFMPKITIVDASPMEEQEYIQTIRVDLAYMDPVYLQTGILTEESDVYSFGIVILEVISRKFPANNGSLVRSFLGIHKKGKKATELFDKEIAVSGNWEILDCLAEIAVQCLSPDRDERPTMTDVAERLLTLQRYRGSQVVRQ